jgi:GT2 family glycosyltransferase
MKLDLSISIVLNDPDENVLHKTLESIANCSLRYKLYLIDNSSSPLPLEKMRHLPMEYIFNNGNVGFGKGHNIALRRSVENSKYHLVLNPDVYFEKDTLEEVFKFMESNPQTGLVLPRVYNSESQSQFVARRLPDPFVLVVRRLNSRVANRLFKERLDRYEMREKDYSTAFQAPFLSGCFMFFRTESLQKVGFFDERFFMYMEDVDLSRRIFRHFRNVYLPEVSIVHGHARASYKSLKALLIHATSAFRYFNKWGWFFDPERAKINTSI